MARNYTYYALQNLTKENNMKEKRTIEISLETAREWYKGDNATLRELALATYTQEELEYNISYIKSKIKRECVNTTAPLHECKKYKTLTDLAIIAKFFNGHWEKTTNNTGYFIGRSYLDTTNPIERLDSINIYKHETVKYAGIVYFKNKEDVIKAIKILGENIEYLF